MNCYIFDMQINWIETLVQFFIEMVRNKENGDVSVFHENLKGKT